MTSVRTSDLWLVIKLIIPALVIYNAFKQERRLEPIVRVVRWAIILALLIVFVLVMVFLPNIPMSAVLVLIAFTTFPAGILFLFPDLTTYIIRGYRALKNQSEAGQ